jgi:hypothetical protein
VYTSAPTAIDADEPARQRQPEAPLQNMHKTEHFLLLCWLLVTGLILFGLVVCWNTGMVQEMIDNDHSYISVVVIGIYAVGLLHSLHRTWQLSRELNGLNRTVQALDSQSPDSDIRVGGGRVQLASGAPLPDGFVSRYVLDLVRSKQIAEESGKAPESRSDILEAYASKIRGANEFGWFLIDFMLKVGFLGTLVGFIWMLGSVSQQDMLDASMMQRVLKQMSHGMSTALNTTLVSLVGGILLSIPYYMLGRGLDELLEQTIHLSEVRIWPRLKPANAAR